MLFQTTCVCNNNIFQFKTKLWEITSASKSKQASKQASQQEEEEERQKYDVQ